MNRTSTGAVFREGRPRLFIVGHDLSYYRPWAKLFALADTIEEADVAMFTGGADVTPEIYGARNCGLSHCDKARDDRELAEYRVLRERNIPMIGICRGSQFITAASGGKLYQHVNGHGGEHEIITEDGKKFIMSSTHHQMMRPKGNFKIIAWAKPRSKVYMTGERTYQEPPHAKDPEIVFYPDIKALCIQGHPEYLPVDSDTNVYCRKLAAELLL